MANGTKKNELAIVPVEKYAIMQADAKRVAQLMAENLDGEELDMGDLTRVTVPAGGGLQWTVPTLDGEESTTEIAGVIIAQSRVRAYWAEDIETGGGGSPPNCHSMDCATGIGEPGGLCATCPFAQFGSSKGGKGRGQACKMSRRLFVMRPDDCLPIMVTVPPSSLKAVKRYLCGMAAESVAYYQAVTILALTRNKNADGIAYSEIAPRLAPVTLTEDQLAAFDGLHQTFAPLVGRIPIEAEEVTAEASGD